MNTLHIVGLSDVRDLWNSVLLNAREFTEPVNQLSRKLVDGAFPPADILIDDKENIYINMALAGFEVTDLKIRFDEEDYLVISHTDESDVEESKNTSELKYVQRGLKSGSFIKKFFVDTRYLDKKSLKATMKNGMLKIKILRKEQNPDDEIKITTE